MDFKREHKLKKIASLLFAIELFLIFLLILLLNTVYSASLLTNVLLVVFGVLGGYLSYLPLYTLGDIADSVEYMSEKIDDLEKKISEKSLPDLSQDLSLIRKDLFRMQNEFLESKKDDMNAGQ